MGMACFGSAIFLFAFNMLSFFREQYIFKGLPYKVLPNIESSVLMIVLGLVLITISYTFKKGVELQQENDLTV